MLLNLQFLHPAHSLRAGVHGIGLLAAHADRQGNNHVGHNSCLQTQGSTHLLHPTGLRKCKQVLTSCQERMDSGLICTHWSRRWQQQGCSFRHAARVTKVRRYSMLGCLLLSNLTIIDFCCITCACVPGSNQGHASPTPSQQWPTTPNTRQKHQCKCHILVPV